MALVASGSVMAQSSAGSMAPLWVSTQLVGQATFDKAKGHVVQSMVETSAASPRALTGYLRMIVVMRPWSPGDSTEPLDMPEPTLK